MKIAVFSDEAGPGLGIVQGNEIAILHRGDAGGALKALIEAGGLPEHDPVAIARVKLSDVRLEPPVVSRDRAVICVGKNYHAHANEFHGSGFDSSANEAVPSAPVVFAKLGSCVVGDGASVDASLDPTGSVDYEGELGVIIGKPTHGVSAEDALDAIFGYTICNDVTSRELQRTHNQWLIGKSLDTFGPVGPWIVTADEIDDITAQHLVTTVNGEERQRASIRDLIFDIPFLIETLSRTMTLQPGDMIATGTPAGVGIGYTPPRYLKPGDRMEVSISGIGTLRNSVV